MNGTKICLEDCRIEGLQFYKGSELPPPEGGGFLLRRQRLLRA